MRSMSLGKGSSVAGILAVILVACDNSPGGPSNPPPNNQGGAAAILSRVELTGPASIAPGGTGQYTATAFYTDGSSHDRTSLASWRSNNLAIITLSPGGVAAGRERGETSISASFGGRTATKSGVMVLPDGTFRVRGAVRDAGFGLTGARVEVTEGAATGLATMTSGGSYSLYGLAGDVEITVTRGGYQPVEQRFQVTGHQTQNFDLALAGPRDVLQGTYTMRARVADECSAFPSALQERVYKVAIAQNGPQLTATLSGATFFRPSQSQPALDTFRGVGDPGGQVTFTLGSGYYYFSYFYYYPEVVEQISTAELFSITGSASVTRTATGFSGTLNGEFLTFGVNSRRSASCKSTRHSFELVGPEK
jgi:hypothetical protein